MNKKKKLLSVILCAALVFALAVPAFAAPIKTDTANSQYIYAWKGSGAAALTYRGVSANITVNTPATGIARNTWSVTPAPHGQYRITYNGYDVNIYRVLQYGTYYLCTAYPYEQASEGRDQRVDILTTGSYSRVRLVQRLDGKTWYMMPDKSAASSDSPVIWYTAAVQDRTYWSAV